MASFSVYDRIRQAIMTGCRFCEGKLAGKLKGDDWHAGALTNACGVSKINHLRLITKFFLVTTQCYHFPNHVVLEKSRHFHMHSGVSKVNQPRLVTKFFSVQRATMLPFFQTCGTWKITSFLHPLRYKLPPIPFRIPAFL